ncbi:hypothetical protein IDM32_02165 [Acinetobacter seifertii]|nr:hypothetical protein [Acinetobacter seifertii]
MANNFNAEQARKNAKDVKIDQTILLEKILSGTEKISKEGKRRAVFQFPIDALHPENITQVEELKARGFNVSTNIEQSGTTVNIEVSF